MTVAATARVRAVPERTRRPGLLQAVHSEFTKIRSLRSSYILLLIFMVASVGYSAINCDAAAQAWAHRSLAWHQQFDAASSSLGATLVLGELVIVVFGAMTLTSEYSTGMITSSLSATPRRSILYVAKAIAFTMVTLVASVITSFAAFFVGQAFLSSKHISVTLTQPHVLRAVLLTAAVVPLLGLLAYGIGAIIRNTAGAITAALGIVFLIPVLAQELPSTWQVSRWLPGIPGISVVASAHGPGPYLFGAWGQFAVVIVWAAVSVAAGLWLFERRDL